MNHAFKVAVAALVFTAYYSLYAQTANAQNAQDLSITAQDLRISQGADGGFHLYIRKKPNVNSVLLTESVRDPELNESNYAYRAPNWNAVNGDEQRIVDGAFLPKESGIWSLIDSTPEPHSELGEAFHIYIPYIIYYGYPWSRSGEVYVGNGTYFNVRAFSKPYGDYTGAFRDNSFILEVTQRPLAGPATANFMKDTEDAFREIANRSQGGLVRSNGPVDIIETIRSIIRKERAENLDVVIALDTTASMVDDLGAIKDGLAAMLNEEKGRFRQFRIGMMFYRDYGDDYVVKSVPFTSSMSTLQKSLEQAKAAGGRDIPEAVYEALYESAITFPWRAESRLIILIGDAPPHPRPRGRITREITISALLEHNIKVEAIILPQ